jgi:hypothetical protein
LAAATYNDIEGRQQRTINAPINAPNVINYDGVFPAPVQSFAYITNGTILNAPKLEVFDPVEALRSAHSPAQPYNPSLGVDQGFYVGTSSIPSSETRVVNSPEIKSASAIKAIDVTNAWDNYLGSNTTSINPKTGMIDPNRIFSADGTKSIRFGAHEMNTIGTTKGHFHYETWTYDATTDTMNVTNILQRIIP